jgi:uncharacterized protein YecE (DUF72 family)
MKGEVRVGISGWRYGGWRGVFYPEGLPQRRELEWASRQLDTIEINGSFYSLQRPEFYRAWHDETPEEFLFAVKGSRFITHMKKLRDVETPLANFFASGVLRLEEKLGPFLWQFPATFPFDEKRFDDFFTLLPRDTAEATRLARGHDERLRGRSWTRTRANRRLRHAAEIRHPSFACDAFVRLLRRHAIGLVVADTAGRWPLLEDVTADFVYVRLHGDEELYVSGYDDRALERWAERIRAWRRGTEPPDARRAGTTKAARRRRARDVYVYFDNDAKVHAPFDARRLRNLLDEA